MHSIIKVPKTFKKRLKKLSLHIGFIKIFINLKVKHNMISWFSSQKNLNKSNINAFQGKDSLLFKMMAKTKLKELFNLKEIHYSDFLIGNFEISFNICFCKTFLNDSHFTFVIIRWKWWKKNVGASLSDLISWNLYKKFLLFSNKTLNWHVREGIYEKREKS